MRNRIGFIILTTALSALLSIQVKAQDNPTAKNGNPCVEELCINDEVKDLLAIKWKKVPVSNTNQRASFKIIGDPKAISTFLRYVVTGSLDQTGLKAFSGIKGFCSRPWDMPTDISGTYTNKKGQLVVVYFTVVPSEDGKSQKFVATKIAVLLGRGRMTEEQYADLGKQVKVKYPNHYKEYNGSPTYPNVSINNITDGIFLILTSQFGQMTPEGVINPSKFQYFPGCGSEERIKL
jgi:hypothetical protein